MDKNWYIIYTASRSEKIVEERIKQLGVEVYLPKYNCKRRWSDRIKVLTLPLFKSHIFVHCSELKLRGVLTIPGVVRVVYKNDTPGIIPISDIEAIKEFSKLSEFVNILSEVEAAKILGAPIRKTNGKIIKYSEGIASLHLDLIGSVCQTLGEV